MRKLLFLLALLSSMHCFSADHGTPDHRTSWREQVSAFFDFLPLPQGTGDLVVGVTDDTCKNDLERWNNESGVKAIVYNVTSPVDLITKLKQRGYGPDKKIGTLALSGHGFNDGNSCYICAKGCGVGSEMSDTEISQLRELLADDAIVWMMGCHVGQNMEPLKRFAVKLKRKVVANSGVVLAGNSGASGTWRTAYPD